MKRVLYALAAGLGLALIGGCSSNTTIAGGSGLGNPTTPVTVSMAITLGGSGGAGLPRACIAKALPGVPDDIPAILPVSIRDMGGVAYQVEAAQITVERIQFVFDKTEAVVVQDLADGLQETGDGLELKGPFLFDLFSGTVQPPVEEVSLPQARYREIRLIFRKKVGADTNTPVVSLAGKFENNQKTAPFSIGLRCNINVSITGEDKTIDISGGQIRRLVIELDASGWLDSVNIGPAIDKGQIEVVPGEGMVLTPADFTGTLMIVEQTIRKNIMRSGRVKLL